MAHQILIAQDDTNFVKAIEDILSQVGYETISCTSYKTMLSCLEANKIDLILMDIFLKEQDGREIVSIIKNNPKFSEIPIIFTTVLDKVEIFLEGNNEVLSNPFSMQTLIATIDHYLGRDCRIR